MAQREEKMTKNQPNSGPRLALALRSQCCACATDALTMYENFPPPSTRQPLSPISKSESLSHAPASWCSIRRWSYLNQNPRFKCRWRQSAGQLPDAAAFQSVEYLHYIGHSADAGGNPSIVNNPALSQPASGFQGF